MSIRTNTAVWVESRQRWQINVQKDGVRKTFTSAKPGRTGQREANRKADEWLEHSVISTSTKVDVLYPQFLASKRATTSLSNCRPMDGRWRNKIQPLIGQKSIGRLTDGDLQQARANELAYAARQPTRLMRVRADGCGRLARGVRRAHLLYTQEIRHAVVGGAHDMRPYHILAVHPQQVPVVGRRHGEPAAQRRRSDEPDDRGRPLHMLFAHVLVVPIVPEPVDPCLDGRILRHSAPLPIVLHTCIPW